MLLELETSHSCETYDEFDDLEDFAEDLRFLCNSGEPFDFRIYDNGKIIISLDLFDNDEED